jgi:hypothetical protein
MGAATLSPSNKVDAPTNKETLKSGTRDEVQIE